MLEPEDTSAPVCKDKVNQIQRVVGTLLYQSRAIDPTTTTALSTLASKQAKATKYTKKKVPQLFDYVATHPNPIIRLSPATWCSNLTATPAISKPANPSAEPEATYTPQNLRIKVPSVILKHIASSAAEAEHGALFVNCKEAMVIGQTLKDINLKQGATPCTTDNSTANSMINDTIKKQRSRAMDMRYMWVQDKVRQGHFVLKWKAGKDNYADYPTPPGWLYVHTQQYHRGKA